jgi:hypothetical protein
MNETHKRLRVGRSMAQSGRGDRATDGGIGVSAKENVTPSNSVVVNPYWRLANAVRVEQAAMVRNPYKKVCSRKSYEISLPSRKSPNSKVRNILSDRNFKPCLADDS